MQNPFKKPTAEQKRAKQLEDAKIDLLNAEISRECWEAECEKLKKRIIRLTPLTIHNVVDRIIE